MNVDFRYWLIEIDKEKKVVNSINIDDFPTEIDNHFYRLLSISINYEGNIPGYS